eukprot:9099658-Pyramimonas_sp.AAC.2
MEKGRVRGLMSASRPTSRFHSLFLGLVRAECCGLARGWTRSSGLGRLDPTADLVKPLIWVECHVERHSKTRVEYLVKARSQFKERSNAVGVEIKLPLPADATTPQ